MPTKPRRSRISALPHQALMAVGRVRGFGIDKYPADHWREVPARDHLDAAMGHVMEHANGRRIDTESGEPALAHAIVRLMMALELEPPQRAEQPKADGSGMADPGRLT